MIGFNILIIHFDIGKSLAWRKQKIKDEMKKLKRPAIVSMVLKHDELDDLNYTTDKDLNLYTSIIIKYQ